MRSPLNLYGITMTLLVIGLFGFIMVIILRSSGEKVKGILEAHRLEVDKFDPFSDIRSLMGRGKQEKRGGTMDNEDREINILSPTEEDFLFLFQILESENPRSVSSAIKVLGEIGDIRGVIPLLKVDSSDEEVDRFACGTAIQILRFQGLKEAATVILEVLNNPNIPLTRFCRSEIAKIKERLELDSPSILSAVLASNLPAPKAKEYAIEKLFGEDAIRTPSTLLKFLEGDEDDLALAACHSLSYLSYREGISVMEKAIERMKDGETKEGCKEAVERLIGYNQLRQ